MAVTFLPILIKVHDTEIKLQDFTWETLAVFSLFVTVLEEKYCDVTTLLI